MSVTHSQSINSTSDNGNIAAHSPLCSAVAGHKLLLCGVWHPENWGRAWVPLIPVIKQNKGVRIESDTEIAIHGSKPSRGWEGSVFFGKEVCSPNKAHLFFPPALLKYDWQRKLNLRHTSGAKGECLAINAYIKKQERSQINNLTLQLKELEKEQTTQS